MSESAYSIRARVLKRLAAWADTEAEREQDGEETEGWAAQCSLEAARLRQRAGLLESPFYEKG